jgi:hypothetical protein
VGTRYENFQASKRRAYIFTTGMVEKASEKEMYGETEKKHCFSNLRKQKANEE